ncbi:ABC transporter ATP-binding protein [Asticcacaulis machinosus]|uniref:ABC transporter ATP-binding protein n=1 Tax=Asticcacaulis machinosus TaxID=2984211 RepID=A0ABT5HNC5_9CAUL|nr:ABC transporter ATP-binding protein [Asticcacaulis machinosus]MDC7677744.1 ABC transporter ATP-binding protein [Asticcacaulis machinosus]
MATKALMTRVWREYLSPQKGALLTSMLCAALVGLATAAVLLMLKPGVELLFGETGPATTNVPAFISNNPLLMVPLIIVIMGFIRLGAQLGQVTLVNRIGHQLVGHIQSQLFANLIRADLARLQKAHSGQYLSSVLFDAGLMREATTNGVVNYTQHGLTVIYTLIAMAFIDWKMTLGVLVIGPIIGQVLSGYMKRTKKAAKGAMEETSSLSSAIMESLDGVKIVKIAHQESFEEGRVNEVIARRQKHIIKGANARASAAPVTEALTTVLIALVIAYAGWRSGLGEMTVGGFTAFLALLGSAAQSLRQLASLQTIMSEGMTAAQRLFAVLDIQPDITDAPGAMTLPRDFKTIHFDDVGFEYAPDMPTLTGINFTAEAGRSIALVGPSGSGKSTLLNLLPRFFDATHGHIRFDDRDQKSFTLKSLRENIALVTQDPFLFDDTIAVNIAYGNPNAAPAAIEKAARDAAAHEFIMDLPNGYNTRVGEAGSRLSGGQKQRIAIARAFLKDAPLLLLDEATSALDTQSEARVQEALERLMAGRTTFMIAHRLSTIRHADEILVLDKGRIVERGTHDGLIASGGLYADLARQQFDMPHNNPQMAAGVAS